MNYSIVIPTYNRSENLELILERLAESVSKRVHVLILTEPNSVSLPMESTLARLSGKLDLDIHINKYKLGVDESILRCYEMCDADWIYFLGDSKLPTRNFEAVMSAAHAALPDAAAYFFRYDSTFNDGQIIKSIEELVGSGLTLGDFILGGNSVFSRKIVEKYINFSYRTLSSRIAHVAMPLMALIRSESLYLSSEKIIDKFLAKPSLYQPGKALLDCWASFSLLALLPISRRDAILVHRYVLKNEDTTDRFIFAKYCLIKIFRERVMISKDIKIILNTRYLFRKPVIEFTMVLFLYFLALTVEMVRR
jgi:hypothetical protein